MSLAPCPARLRNLAVLLAMLVISTAALPPASLAQQTAPPRASRPFPPPQYIPDHDFDTRHIALNLRFDWEREQVSGTETIVLVPLVNNLDHIVLDAANITFTSVKLNSGSALKFDTDVPDEKLRIALDRPYQPSNELTLLIEYHTNGLTDQARSAALAGGGLRFIKPTADDPKRPKQVWSQGESEYNHYWFACYDHPNDFFTSDLTATVEKPLSVVSNGKLMQTKENQDGTRTFHWSIEQPHASYLSSIIVGEYVSITSDYLGIPIMTNVYPHEVNEGRVTVARLLEMVKFFSEKTGVKYPYAKYAQTMVRDFGGGMENISATTQTDNMIHDARTELDQTSDGLQSHELAHQWFGDYLTCRTWADIWLNESFATYFQAMWDEYKLGHDDFLYVDVRGNQNQYFGAWNQGNRRPIVTKNYANPDAVFDTYAYPRGGAVLHMLRRNLGEENWWRAINHYLRKYAHQPVETEEFRVAIEESTGQSMDWFFDEWLYRMGHPVFRISQNYDAAAKALKLTVEQRQQVDPEWLFPQVAYFRTPVEVEIETGSGTRIERVMIEPQKEQTFTFKSDSKPLLVNFDYGGTLIKELEFTKTNDELIYQLTKDQDVLGRLWALGQINNRLRAESAPQPEKELLVKEVSMALSNDSFWGMRVEAALALSGISGDVARQALLKATKDKKPAVRTRALLSLAASKDPSLAQLYRSFLNDESYAVIRGAAVALGQTKDPAAYESLTKLLETPSWRDNIKASALTGLASLEDKRALEIGLRLAQKGNPPQARAAALRLIGVIGTQDERVYPLLADTVKQSLFRNEFSLALASGEALVSLGDPRGLALFEDLAKQAVGSPQIQNFVSNFQGQLKKKLDAAAKAPTN
ncbi:MAG TPA: M1 family aminopeptidase [Pyrinomonadaceae bacterium]|nr:M1 family aminopeptidase [Pyrinomonadaceae bacterium]